MAEQQELQELLGNQNTSGSQVGSALTPPTSEIQQQVEGRVLYSNPSQAPSQGVSSSQEIGNKRKPTRPASGAWTHFKKVGNKAISNYCGKKYASNSNYGTTNLLKHLKVCSKNPHKGTDKKQKRIVFGRQCEDYFDGAVTMKLVEFNQEQCRSELVKMIVIDELPFKFVENQGFRDFMSVVQPQFIIPDRKTIARDCLQLFREEKVKLKYALSCNHQMVSLTTNTWTSIQNVSYMCVTAHFIDEEWKLNKKILSFGLIADHKGETIGKALEKCMKDWGIVKICTITMDNASANNSALAYLVRGMSDWNGSTLLKGEYMHIKCCAHILNSIVSDELKELDCSIGKIRAVCKYVRSSPARLASFRRCVQEANIVSNQMPVLDVPTRWNSTYLMLEVAEKFEKAFTRLEYDDPAYMIALDNEEGPPNSDDWNRACVLRKFLKIFYDTTLSFSGSLHVTSNTFFHKLCDIQNTLNKWIESDDIRLQRVATNMKTKFDKYWDINEKLNYLLFVAIFLDPRYKLEYVDFCFGKMYGQEKCKDILKKLKVLIKNLFAHYAVLHPLPSNTGDSSGLLTEVASQTHVKSNNVDDRWSLEDEFRLWMKRKQGDFEKNELERYMEDDVEDDYDGFDILRWWKGKTMKYHVLSRMARDILAIPVSTVSSESAFSTGGRVLDLFRSSLNPTVVEALICTQNWLRSTKKVSDSPSQMDEVEQVESELSGMSRLEEVEVDNVF